MQEGEQQHGSQQEGQAAAPGGVKVAQASGTDIEMEKGHQSPGWFAAITDKPIATTPAWESRIAQSRVGALAMPSVSDRQAT
ncbi:hypothetical protein G114_07885 [Aeromonas diversa CDC 2478-85]|uniref:Uncharacterized protein n=1 Tax=Aeromonas diversa CDC 2478-85 TaxID=1268237 RepID=N9VB12_9GAMM|nr:hypothetical protein G114_07885 [Aeromonas diversa CDC 2478-85]